MRLDVLRIGISTLDAHGTRGAWLEKKSRGGADTRRFAHARQRCLAEQTPAGSFAPHEVPQTCLLNESRRALVCPGAQVAEMPVRHEGDPSFCDRTDGPTSL